MSQSCHSMPEPTVFDSKIAAEEIRLTNAAELPAFFEFQNDDEDDSRSACPDLQKKSSQAFNPQSGLIH